MEIVRCKHQSGDDAHIWIRRFLNFPMVLRDNMSTIFILGLGLALSLFVAPSPVHAYRALGDTGHSHESRSCGHVIPIRTRSTAARLVGPRSSAEFSALGSVCGALAALKKYKEKNERLLSTNSSSA